jgi:O-antigen ligase
LGGEDRPAHSAWIKTLAENGLQGFLLMTAWVFSFAFRGLQRKEPERLFFGILVSAVMAAGFVTTEFQGKHLWFLMAAELRFLTRKKWKHG